MDPRLSNGAAIRILLLKARSSRHRLHYFLISNALCFVCVSVSVLIKFTLYRLTWTLSCSSFQFSGLLHGTQKRCVCEMSTTCPCEYAVHVRCYWGNDSAATFFFCRCIDLNGYALLLTNIFSISAHYKEMLFLTCCLNCLAVRSAIQIHMYNKSERNIQN